MIGEDVPTEPPDAEVRSARWKPSSGMTVQFWGVRGSIACPEPELARYGGNTACVEVRCGDRLRSTDQHIAEVALLQLPVRLAKALLRMADSEAHMGPSRNAATVQLSQRELGNIVGAARESVNKCLRDWQRSGLVRIEGTSITISNRATLEDVAEQG